MERIPNPMTPYLQCGRILGVMRDGRMVLCQLPLGHSCERCTNMNYEAGRDYIEIEAIEEFSEQRKATA